MKQMALTIALCAMFSGSAFGQALGKSPSEMGCLPCMPDEKTCDLIANDPAATVAIASNPQFVKNLSFVCLDGGGPGHPCGVDIERRAVYSFSEMEFIRNGMNLDRKALFEVFEVSKNGVLANGIELLIGQKYIILSRRKAVRTSGLFRWMPPACFHNNTEQTWLLKHGWPRGQGRGAGAGLSVVSPEFP